ncbi:MAG: hypothetical protein HQL11_05640 [Candidatus Omnitrophica bacterium]|nr:hypothetical protein [Candidatus Omnitrophota bacterium]
MNRTEKAVLAVLLAALLLAVWIRHRQESARAVKPVIIKKEVGVVSG